MNQYWRMPSSDKTVAWLLLTGYIYTSESLCEAAHDAFQSPLLRSVLNESICLVVPRMLPTHQYGTYDRGVS